jgi:crotonobetainyl-CoA:carnitine CoA-transferase CaiB-like acyl-CoA transferase
LDRNAPSRIEREIIELVKERLHIVKRLRRLERGLTEQQIDGLTDWNSKTVYTQYWLDKLTEAGVPCAPVLTVVRTARQPAGQAY